METPIQDNAHRPVPMADNVKKLTQREIAELLREASNEEEPGQYFGANYPRID